MRGEIPAKKVYEDDLVLAFHDIQPVAPVHLLLVPKGMSPSLYEAAMDDEPVLGRLLALAPKIAKDQGAADGFRTIVNTGRVGRQEVQHVHLHVIGGPDPLGPMILRKSEVTEIRMGR